MFNLKTKMTRNCSDWSKILQRERQISTSLRLRYQLVDAAQDFAREEILTRVLIPRMSKDMNEQLKLDHKIVDVVDRANRKICVSLLRYDVDKPESSYAQVRLFARKKQDEKLQQVFYVNSKFF